MPFLGQQNGALQVYVFLLLRFVFWVLIKDLDLVEVLKSRPSIPGLLEKNVFRRQNPA